jgi:tetratricopeptide (TPR) repeat protein
MGDKAGNIAEIKEYIQCNPRDEQGYFNLAISLHTMKQYDEAMVAYRKAIALKPENHDTYYNLGSALYENNEHNAALKEFENAIQINPDYIPAYYFISTILLEKGDLDATRKIHEEIFNKFGAKVGPNHANNHFNLGKILLQRETFDEALKEFERAFEIDKYFFECFFYIGTILNQKGKKDDAIKYLSNFIDLAPNSKGFLELKEEAQNLIKG